MLSVSGSWSSSSESVGSEDSSDSESSSEEELPLEEDIGEADVEGLDLDFFKVDGADSGDSEGCFRLIVEATTASFPSFLTAGVREFS